MNLEPCLQYHLLHNSSHQFKPHFQPSIKLNHFNAKSSPAGDARRTAQQMICLSTRTNVSEPQRSPSTLRRHKITEAARRSFQLSGNLGDLAPTGATAARPDQTKHPGSHMSGRPTGNRCWKCGLGICSRGELSPSAQHV